MHNHPTDLIDHRIKIAFEILFSLPKYSVRVRVRVRDSIDSLWPLCIPSCVFHCKLFIDVLCSFVFGKLPHVSSVVEYPTACMYLFF